MAANMATTIQRSRVVRERGFIVGYDSRKGLPTEVTFERLGIKRSRGSVFWGRIAKANGNSFAKDGREKSMKQGLSWSLYRFP
jgi:hypothetical protein